MQATLKRKLGVDREAFLILGACNPPLAHGPPEAEPELRVLLPCNVVVTSAAVAPRSRPSTPSRCWQSSETTSSSRPLWRYVTGRQR